MLERALECEVEQKRVVVVDLFERVAFLGADVATSNERAHADQNVDRGQWIVAAVYQSIVKVLTMENGVKRTARAVELRHRRCFAEEQTFVALLVHQPHEQIEIVDLGSRLVVEIFIRAQTGAMSDYDFDAMVQRTSQEQWIAELLIFFRLDCLLFAAVT